VDILDGPFFSLSEGVVMSHCKLLGLLALGVLALGVGAANAEEKKGDKDKHGSAFMDCAKARGICAGMCDACSAHCARMLAEGKKDHLGTLRTCQDCATICGAAACVTARGGPFSDTICTACAEACKRCGDACEKYKEDDMMRRCTEECRKCEKACRVMLKHTQATSGE
jgi:hypothetical protein